MCSLSQANLCRVTGVTTGGIIHVDCIQYGFALGGAGGSKCTFEKAEDLPVWMQVSISILMASGIGEVIESVGARMDEDVFIVYPPETK